MIERAVATYKAHVYERVHYERFFKAQIVYCLVAGILGSIGYLYNILTPVFAAAYSIPSTMTICVATLCIIKQNRKQLRALPTPGYTLSKKYQLTENEKALKAISMMIWFAAINNVIAGGFFIFNRSDAPWFWRNIVGVIMSIQHAKYSLTLAILLHISNRQIFEDSVKVLRKKWKQLSPTIRVVKYNLETPGSFIGRILGTSGQDLYLGAKQEDYFTQLDKQWDPQLVRS
ncbi:unnamed protein product, partial [Mesorhabditis spiculigera]